MTAESNPMQRSKSTVALLDAYDRLREGKGSATDGKLSVTNVAREAAVGRATAYRCPELLARFGEHPRPAKAKPKTVSGNAELRDAVNRLLNRIVMLEAALEGKDAEIRQLRSMLPKMQEASS